MDNPFTESNAALTEPGNDTTPFDAGQPEKVSTPTVANIPFATSSPPVEESPPPAVGEVNQPFGPPPVGAVSGNSQSGNSPFGTPAVPEGQTQFFSGGGTSSPRYNIIDLYWLINQKLINKTQMAANEAHLLTIGYNASFGNMRMTFYTCDQNSFTPSSIILGNSKRIATANMYPEACLEVLSKKESNQSVMLFERVIRADNKWTPNQSSITWAPKAIRIQTIDQNNNTILFDLTAWHIAAFESALKFMITGKSWNMNMQSQFHK